jgi:hypothetical protein
MMQVAEDRWEMGYTTLKWQVPPGQPQLLDEVLAWFKSSAEGGATRYTTTRVANSDAGARLLRFGYVHDPGAPWFLLNTCTLGDLDTAPLPRGFKLRTAKEVDASRAVAVHRAPWSQSQFTARSLSDVRATWPYRDDLAVFVEDPQGMLVASALVRSDESNRTAELEPVGTDPNHRRHGSGAPSACSG